MEGQEDIAQHPRRRHSDLEIVDDDIQAVTLTKSELKALKELARLTFVAKYIVAFILAIFAVFGAEPVLGFFQRHFK